MSFKSKSCVALVALSVAMTGAVIPIKTAEAQNLFDVLFKTKEQRARERNARQEALKPKVVKKPIKRISGPKYYTYKVDKLVKLDFGALTDPVTTGSVNEDAETPVIVEPVELTAFQKSQSLLETIDLRAHKSVAEAVTAHYAADPNFIWVQDGAPNTKARDVLAYLATAEDVGLRPEDYAVKLPAERTETGEDVDVAAARERALIDFEVEMSIAALTYAMDATRGRIDPNRISGFHDLARKEIDLGIGLRVIAAFSNAADYLKARNPSGDHFKMLVEERKALIAADAETNAIEIAPDTFLKPGRTHEELPNIVAAIRQKGSDALKVDHALVLADYADTTEYTSDLVLLVKAFQKENNLAADGIVGKNTIRKMVGITNAAKIRKVELAMERARWIDHKLPSRRVFINQPSFQVTYWNDHQQELAMRVVVGKKRHQTNFFKDEIERVEFNPYWGVPQSIIANEMMPKLYNDPSYLDRLGYEVTVGGKRVSSRNVNWGSVSTARVGVRQPPGRKNALGELKILFPNKHAIYMHDTPAKSLFKKDTRAYSHGCVRLERPRDMAAAVLGITTDDVANHIATGKNTPVHLDKTIPVYVAYFTAWPNSEGAVEYFADVYDRDKFLEKAIDATEKVRGTVS